MSDPRELELARRELQRLGYLSHRVERFLLRDALEPVGEPRALALLAAKVGLLAGMLLALANTLALASANGLLARLAARPPAALPASPAAAGRGGGGRLRRSSSRGFSSRSSSSPGAVSNG